MALTATREEKVLGSGAAALAVIGVILLVAGLLRPSVTVTGLADGGAVKPAALQDVEIATSAPLDQMEVMLDGAPVPVRREGNRVRLAGPEPREGQHTLLVRTPGIGGPLPGTDKTIDFTVDATPPRLTVQPVTPTELDAPSEVRGTADGASSVLADGREVQLGADGSFTVSLPPGVPAVDITAADLAGNTATKKVSIPVRHPGMRAVHMTALAWSAPSLREPVLEMAREKRIDTVQLDIKDESGEVGYASRVPLANEIGATRGYYDARSALDELHAAGLRVVGRIVVFRDPILAEASWSGGHSERVLQTADGAPYSGGYGQFAFTNFANPEVRGYNIALAEEAAALGFDDILYDYVRRPDGAFSRMYAAGLTTSPEAAIAGFLAETRPVVRKHGSLLGASVYGISATRPTEIAQDIPAISAHVDYVAPMVYPSHWGVGEYNVADPESQPYDITARSLADFAALTKETSTAVIPWLQAFSLRVSYGPQEVRAQIKAAESAGITSFLLWNANCRYEPAALDPVTAQ